MLKENISYVVGMIKMESLLDNIYNSIRNIKYFIYSIPTLDKLKLEGLFFYKSLTYLLLTLIDSINKISLFYSFKLVLNDHTVVILF